MSSWQTAIFFGHGNPMNALALNGYSAAWQRIGAEITRPKAILAISAHWYGPGTAVTASIAPPTIHDFSGFPRELYEVRYPAPGDPALARRVQGLLAPVEVGLDGSWGLDHGTWSVLQHAYPAADIPIVQLRLDATRPAAFHFEMGRRLAPLRQEGIMIMGSGNLVHNLSAYAWGRENVDPYDWALRFEAAIKGMMEAGDDQGLVHYDALGPDAALSVPTPEHYLPLLYVLATRQGDEAVRFPVAGVDGGSISMLSVQLG